MITYKLNDKKGYQTKQKALLKANNLSELFKKKSTQQSFDHSLL